MEKALTDIYDELCAGIAEIVLNNCKPQIERKAKQKVLERMKAIYQSELNAFKADPKTDYKNGFMAAMEYCLDEIVDELKELDK